MTAGTVKTQKAEWKFRMYTELYEGTEMAAKIRGLDFYYKENNGRLTIEEIGKVCEEAAIKAYVEYDPEKEEEFTMFRESVIKHALANAIFMKENQRLNEYYEVLLFAAEGSPEEKLYAEYKKYGASPLVKQHAVEFLFDKRRQYRERGYAES